MGRQRIAHSGSGESVDKYGGGARDNNGFMVAIVPGSFVTRSGSYGYIYNGFLSEIVKNKYNNYYLTMVFFVNNGKIRIYPIISRYIINFATYRIIYTLYFRLYEHISFLTNYSYFKRRVKFTSRALSTYSATLNMKRKIAFFLWNARNSNFSITEFIPGHR